jgi:hypothetical protein
MNDNINSVFKETATILIVGNRRSGKTNLAWFIAQAQHQRTNKKVYILGCPKTDILNQIPFQVTNVHSKNGLEYIKDGIVIIDEFNTFFPPEQRNSNAELGRILQLSAQNNTTFIFIVHHGLNINKTLIKNINTIILKQYDEEFAHDERPLIKRMLSRAYFESKDDIFIYSPNCKGRFQIPKVPWFNDALSCMFQLKENIESQNAIMNIINSYPPKITSSSTTTSASKEIKLSIPKY